jgi:hypothetical protein
MTFFSFYLLCLFSKNNFRNEDNFLLLVVFKLKRFAFVEQTYPALERKKNMWYEIYDFINNKKKNILASVKVNML